MLRETVLLLDPPAVLKDKLRTALLQKGGDCSSETIQPIHHEVTQELWGKGGSGAVIAMHLGCRKHLHHHQRHVTLQLWL